MGDFRHAESFVLISGRRRNVAVLATLIAACLFPWPACAADQRSPTLLSVAFSPQSISTAASTRVTISFAAAAESGIAYFEAVFVDPSGTVRRSASAKFPPAASVTASVGVDFSRFEKPGMWTLSQVFLADASGQTTLVTAGDLSRLGTATRLEVKSPADTEQPRLIALRIAPAVLDLRESPGEVTIECQFSDVSSGVDELSLALTSPTGAIQQSAAKLGGSQAGTVTIHFKFPSTVESGIWTLSSAFLSDVAGNTLSWDAKAITDAGIENQVRILSTTDSIAPTLTGIRIIPNTVDAWRGPSIATVEISASDDRSGVRSAEVDFVSPSGNDHRSGSMLFEPARTTSGTIVLTFPQTSEEGRWTLNSVLLSDAAGNTSILDSGALKGIGSPLVLNVQTVTDSTPPVLTALRFEPRTIKLAGAPAVLHFEFSATDDLSGVSSVEVTVDSPSGAQRLTGTANFAPSVAVSGAVELAFPDSSEPGRWTIRAILVTDNRGNTSLLDTPLITRLGFPATVEFVRPE